MVVQSPLPQRPIEPPEMRRTAYVLVPFGFTCSQAQALCYACRTIACLVPSQPIN